MKNTFKFHSHLKLYTQFLHHCRPMNSVSSFMLSDEHWNLTELYRIAMKTRWCIKGFDHAGMYSRVRKGFNYWTVQVLILGYFYG